jgi:hypothetical protein
MANEYHARVVGFCYDCNRKQVYILKANKGTTSAEPYRDIDTKCPYCQSSKSWYLARYGTESSYDVVKTAWPVNLVTNREGVVNVRTLV